MPSGVGTVTIADSEVTLSTNTTGEFSAVVDIQVPHGQRWTFPSDSTHGIEFYGYTHQSETVTTDSGTETVTLDNNLVNSPALRDIETSSSTTEITGPRSLVVWDNESDFQTGVNAVDYDANSFDYTTPSATDRPLEIYYLWGDSAQLEFRSYDRAEEEYQKELIKSVREFHEADVYNENSRISFPESFTLRSKEHLKLTLKTDVDMTNWDSFDSNNPNTVSGLDTYSYSYFKLPVIKQPDR